MLFAFLFLSFLNYTLREFVQFPIGGTKPVTMVPNPMEKMQLSAPAPVSSQKYLMAGLLTTVYGLEEIPEEVTQVSVLWLLHPRLGNQNNMAPLANHVIRSWNQHLSTTASKSLPGLIAVALDQRNHGSRKLDPIANGDWRSGDEQHAQDMFSAFQGTQLDVSQLISYLASYVFPQNEKVLVDHMAIGISLGGHCAWQCALHDPRITTVVVVIGCPDYINLMKQRARLSKRETWWKSDPPGSEFIGSTDFPLGLVEAVKMYDPAALLIGTDRNGTETYSDPTQEEQKLLIPLMDSTLQGKRILNLAGAKDNLVPHAQGAAFMNWLRRAIKPGGWYGHGGIHFEDYLFDGVGHAMSSDMTTEATRFLMESLKRLETKSSRLRTQARQAKL